jgi:hypothetical protein
MIVRGGGPSSGYVSIGFYGGKYLVVILVFHSFPGIKPFSLVRSHFGSYRLSRGDQEGKYFTLY